MKYIFGPVPSRRLGLSLGVDIVPMKTCTLSCIYCQIGKTLRPTLERREYVPQEAVIAELENFFNSGGITDWVTFSGSGEPTLNSGIGPMIRRVKEITDTPVCVITNGTLLDNPVVRHDIIDADAVMPSLDSAIEETFRRICRPHPDLSVQRIIEGLVSFRKEFKGDIWLEIMLAEGINDSDDEIEALRQAIERIQPDAVQLNTVVRPPAESFARPVSPARLAEIKDAFGNKAEIIASFKGTSGKTALPPEEAIREYLKRRPGSFEDIITSLGLGRDDAESALSRLTATGEIMRREHFGKVYWEYSENSNE